MKWTENGVEFEGTPDEYLALHRPVEPLKRVYKQREGTHITVIDLGGDEHKFVRVKDAASYISQAAQRSFTATNLAKRTSDRIYLKDYMHCNKAWNPEIHQETPAV